MGGDECRGSGRSLGEETGVREGGGFGCRRWRRLMMSLQECVSGTTLHSKYETLRVIIFSGF